VAMVAVGDGDDGRVVAQDVGQSAWAASVCILG